MCALYSFMQVRHLSPTSFWIETPLTTQTPRLMWWAMNECGLVRGKINSSSTTHFTLDHLEGQCIVQGLTRPGVRADNVMIQAHLRPEENGTCVTVDAANANGHFDFGAAARLKGQFAANLENFFRHVTSKWEQQIESEETSFIAPIAAPTAPEVDVLTRYEAPEFGVVLPFDHEAPYRQLRYVLYVAGAQIANTLAVLGLFILVLWCWRLWDWRRGQKMLWWEHLLFIGASVYEFGHRYMHWF